jgi:hypothetical protein
MSDEQQQPATAEAKPDVTPAAAPEAKSEAKSEAKPKAKPARRWPAPEVWLLGALGVLGLAGFAVVFSLVMARTTPNPQAVAAATQAPGAAQQLVTTPQGAPAVPGAQGERGPQGPPGPQGPRGANGDAGIRIVRTACNGDCSMQCEPDEVLLTAHCGVGRAPAIYPTESSALCRSRSNARVEVVAACVKSVRR